MSAVIRSVSASGPNVSRWVRRCDSAHASVNPSCWADRVATARRACSTAGFATAGRPPWDAASSTIVEMRALRSSVSSTNGSVNAT
jgi:hypothetical protein